MKHNKDLSKRCEVAVDQRENRRKRDLEKIDIDVSYRKRIEDKIEELNQEEKNKR
jgi:hypothetical protein